MRIPTDNVWAYPDGQFDLVERALTYKAPGYVHSSAYKNGYWDGTTCLLNKRGAKVKFPAGLAGFVADYISAFGQEVAIIENAERPTDDNVPPPPRVEADAEQQAAIDAALEHTRGLIHYPTGSGKTIVLAELCRLLQVPTLVLCDKQVLLDQLWHELNALTGMKVGVIGGGHGWQPNPEGVTVATVQSLVARLAWKEEILKTTEAVLVDEAHHLASDTYGKVMAALPNAYYRIGVSATPYRYGGKGEDLKVIGWTGPVIASLKATQAVATGRLVPADITIVKGAGRWPKQDHTGINYTDSVTLGIVTNDRRNLAIAELVLAFQKRGKPTVVLVDRVGHGAILSTATGVPFLSGTDKAARRRELFGDFRAGRLNSLIVSKIGDEGLDLPNLEVLILAAAGRVPHRQIQRIGRGMRASDGKTHLTVFDFEDAGRYLSRHFRRRVRTYEEDPAFTVVNMKWTELKELL